MVEAMDVGVGGGIGEEPTFIDWVRQRVPADEVPGMIANLVEAYAALREEGQTFREWVDATGHETIVELAEPEEVEGTRTSPLPTPSSRGTPSTTGIARRRRTRRASRFRRTISRSVPNRVRVYCFRRRRLAPLRSNGRRRRRTG